MTPAAPKLSSSTRRLLGLPPSRARTSCFWRERTFKNFVGDRLLIFKGQRNSSSLGLVSAMRGDLSFFPRHPFHLMSDASSSSPSHSEVEEAFCFQDLRALKKKQFSSSPSQRTPSRILMKRKCRSVCACVCPPRGKRKRRSAQALSPAPRAHPQAAHTVSGDVVSKSLFISFSTILSMCVFVCACNILRNIQIFFLMKVQHVKFCLICDF